MSKSRRRNSKGRYIRKYDANIRPLLWLMVGVAVLGLIWTYFKKHEELVDPCNGCSFFMVRAAELEIIEEPIFDDPRPFASIVHSEFGDEHFEDAMKIMFCESRNNPETVGDTHIMSINNETGELVGDSIGLFQVRTGSHDWNRAARNGMTADEFRAWLKVPENNIKYARDIFDRRGWSAWWNCMNKELDE